MEDFEEVGVVWVGHDDALRSGGTEEHADLTSVSRGLEIAQIGLVKKHLSKST